MKLNTASAVISFTKQLENESAKFYESLAGKYAHDRDIPLTFAKENGRYVKEIERAYYSAITDAIEGCFAFDIETDEYMLETSLPPNTSYSDALAKAVGIEEKIIKFYSDAAQQSQSLMADVPRTFKLVAKKRSTRRQKLNSCLEKARGG